MKNVLLTCGLFLWCMLDLTTGIGQVSPGGVSTGLTLWLEVNSGLTNSGNELAGWVDRTAINTFTPSPIKPSVNSNRINFYPAVGFSNTDPVTQLPSAYLAGNTSINYADAYAVIKYNLNNTSGNLLGAVTAGSAYGVGIFASFGATVYSGNGSFGNYSSIPFNDNSLFHIFNLDQSPTTPVAMIGRVDGSLLTTTVNLDFTSTSFIPMIGGTNNNGSAPLEGWPHFQGELAEIIVYSQSTETSRDRIESYLALKYGIDKTGDFISSTGTVFWNAGADASYNNDVFGIGRDDGSGLTQANSNSINTGSGDGTGQNAKANIVLASASSIADQSFLLIGNNAGSLTEQTTELPPDPQFANMERLTREWRVQQTGTSGTVNMSFDATGVNIGLPLSSTVLLVSTGDGDFSSGSYRTYENPVVNGNLITFAGITLNNNDYFTFTTPILVSVPLSLVLFNGRHEDRTNYLEWRTVHEQNTDRFEIEYRIDGRLFSTIGVVQAAGHSDITRNYSFSHPNVQGTAFYRLKMIDRDGLFTYSAIIRVTNESECRGAEFAVQQVSPIPFHDKFTIQYCSSADNVVNAYLYDQGGRLIAVQGISLMRGNGVVTINGLGKLQSGIYILRLQNPAGKVSNQVKLVKN